METKIHYWTKDVEKVISYYIEKLGLDLLYRQPLEGLANFCILKISDSQIMFAGLQVFDMINRKDRNQLIKREYIEEMYTINKHTYGLGIEILNLRDFNE